MYFSKLFLSREGNKSLWGRPFWWVWSWIDPCRPPWLTSRRLPRRRPYSNKCMALGLHQEWDCFGKVRGFSWLLGGRPAQAYCSLAVLFYTFQPSRLWRARCVLASSSEHPYRLSHFLISSWVRLAWRTPPLCCKDRRRPPKWADVRAHCCL